MLWRTEIPDLTISPRLRAASTHAGSEDYGLTSNRETRVTEQEGRGIRKGGAQAALRAAGENRKGEGRISELASALPFPFGLSPRIRAPRPTKCTVGLTIQNSERKSLTNAHPQFTAGATIQNRERKSHTSARTNLTAATIQNSEQKSPQHALAAGSCCYSVKNLWFASKEACGRIST